MADEVNENIFLVNAPAGSGKTTWIRQQVESYLLRNPKDTIINHCIFLKMLFLDRILITYIIIKHIYMDYLRLLDH